MGARSLERDLGTLDYPIAKLRDFAEAKAGALDRRGSEIMAEWLELRLTKIRDEAEFRQSLAQIVALQAGAEIVGIHCLEPEYVKEEVSHKRMMQRFPGIPAKYSWEYDRPS